jgi:hypothetical protein
MTNAILKKKKGLLLIKLIDLNTIFLYSPAEKSPKLDAQRLTFRKLLNIFIKFTGF